MVTFAVKKATKQGSKKSSNQLNNQSRKDYGNNNYLSGTPTGSHRNQRSGD
jgi:hypothetical protein